MARASALDRSASSYTRQWQTLLAPSGQRNTKGNARNIATPPPEALPRGPRAVAEEVDSRRKAKRRRKVAEASELVQLPPLRVVGSPLNAMILPILTLICSIFVQILPYLRVSYLLMR